MRKNRLVQVGSLALAAAISAGAMPAYANSGDAGVPGTAPDTSGEDEGTLDPFGGTIDPFGGNIDPFGGTIDPFGGSIDPFGGSIDPFGGTIDPFGGNIDPFGGSIDPFGGAIDPFYSDIAPLANSDVTGFWHDFQETWNSLNTTLAAGSTTKSLLGASTFDNLIITTSVNDLISQSETFWGERVQLATGKSFRAGFVDPLFAEFGLSANDPSSFANLSKSDRARFVFAWYDGLMEFSGTDRVDHWMNTVRWNPGITKIQGSGADSVIGLLDGNIAMDSSVQGNLISSGGYSNGADSHGSGVISLIIGAHDGKGVQGIAPNASVVAYNPFDETGSASWRDIRLGIRNLKQRGASVINLSLGVPNWTFHKSWDFTLNRSFVNAYVNDTVFVFAAGNDGSTQTTDVVWNKNSNLALLIVGSIDPRGKISDFSNRPGTACFVTAAGVCNEGERLMDRFIVAPGELILVSDGHGGTTRVNGTSFAAPLVSGAITLLHDRWQWLTQYPEETANIILDTARDLGEEGTDPIYGRGLLDVQASQSPIDFNNLVFYELDKNNVGLGMAKSAGALRTGGVKTTWEANETYFYAFETIGRTHRDFAIPVSTRLVGQKTGINGSEEYFQSYISSRFQDWIRKGNGFSDVASYASNNPAGWNFAMTSSDPVSRTVAGGYIVREPNTSIKFTDPTQKLAFSLGQGQGARALTGNSGFGLTSDYDRNNGGVNPLLGYASGGAFFDAEYEVAKDTRLAFGYTENTFRHSENELLDPVQQEQLRGLEDYRADAMSLRLTHNAGENAEFSLGYAILREKNGLLGVQSTLDSDFESGSKSQTLTFGANFKLPENISLAASATAGLTSTDNDRQSFTTAGDGVMTSAFAVSMTKQGLFGKNDMLRVSVSQPMHIENGDLEFTSVQVTDRTTGELGEVKERFSIAGESRKLTSELLYSAPVFDKSGEMSLFGRMDYRLNPENNKNVDGMVIGARVKIAF